MGTVGSVKIENKQLAERISDILGNFGLNNHPNAKALLNAIVQGVNSHSEPSPSRFEFNYQAIFDGAHEPMFLIEIRDDKSYHFFRINGLYEQLHGIKNDEVEGKTAVEALGEELGEKIENGCRQSVEKEQTVSFIEENENGDATKYLSTNFTPVKINNKYRVVIGFLEDKTEPLLAEKALQVSEERFRSLYENATVGIYRTSYDGRILMANPTLIRMLGYNSFAELTHRNLKQEGYEPDYPRELFLSKIEATGEVHGLESAWTLRDGSSIHVLESAKLIRDKNGYPLFFDGIVEDISERKKTQIALEESEEKFRVQNEELKRLNDTLTQANLKYITANRELIASRQKAEKSDQLKTAFLTNMSHEIRTPMNAIIGFSDMLMNPSVKDDKRFNFTRILNSSCHTLLSVIDGIIDISKIETDQMEVSSTSININSTIKKIKDIYASQAEQKGIAINLSLPLPDENAEVFSDQLKLTQILTNLITNAIKFSDSGSIAIGYSIKPNEIEFFVKDSGIGIDPKHHTLIFERFRQVEESETRKYGGNGLGLAICKAFVRILQGKIWVESELGKGSTFLFTLPFNPTATRTSHSTQSENTEHKKFDFSNNTVIVAEDEKANFMFMEEMLAPTNVRILHATNGMKAIDLFRDAPWVDLILMDVKMPNLNGLEATRAIKALRADVPIIAVTAYALGGDKERCLGAGCDAYISKPINRDELMELMVKYLLKKN